VATGRIRFIGIIVAGVALLYAARLYYVQIIKGDSYRSQADAQYVSQSSPIFDRGAIYFTTKDGVALPAATLDTGYTIAIDPSLVKNPEDDFNLLSNILPLNEATFMAQAGKHDLYEVIADKVSRNVRDRIVALDITGVEITEEKWRFYPASTTAAHLVGFVGYNKAGDALTGEYGLEQNYNDVLSRGSGDLYVNFFAELFANIQTALSSGDSVEGDVVTNIEPSVQNELEYELAGVQSKYQTDLDGGIIMDPKTGAIYAMGSLPTFDPNDPSAYAKSTVNVDGNTIPQSVFIDPLVEDRFEMGSIVKPIAMSVALEAGAVTPTTTYNDTGFVMIDGKKISNFDHVARGTITMQKVLNDSLNVGMAYVESRTGKQAMRDGLLRFDIGSTTGIDLPGEISGQVSNLNAPRDLELANASFGQGIAMSPIETTRALAALANGGILPDPHIASGIEYPTGISKVLTYDPTDRAISTTTAEAITQMLINVNDQGEAAINPAAYLAHYTTADKTGTAQIANPAGGGYYTDRYLHSFFGYFPAYDPKFIIFLFAVNPHGQEYASHTLLQPFIDLRNFLISYYDIPPDR
jgi:cell division protein FtsI/penicillin-binding protein 2